MSNLINRPYEISLWEDVLTFVVSFYNEVGTFIKKQEYYGSLANFENPEGYLTQTEQYYKEQKICIIGSDTMTTPIRAFQPRLVRNINGSSTLTFSIYSQYYDEETQELVENPFVKLLVNERKIKVRDGLPGECKWYDLIIKNIQEDSESKVFSYTAKDQFINELSKTGFDLEFAPELENNTGTVVQLGERILEGSDWKIKDGSDILQQTKNEPLYEITLSHEIVGTNMTNSADTIVIPAGKKIYAFYSSIVEQSSYFQFLYSPTFYELDDDYVITNSPNYYTTVSYSPDGVPDITDAQSIYVSEKYRGKRLVRKIVTKYDSTIDKYVNVYNSNGKEIYGYTETEYVSPAAVQSYITNPNSYSSYTGWEVGGIQTNEGVDYPQLDLACIPDPRDITFENFGDTEFKGYLKLKVEKRGQVLFNSGVSDFRSSIKDFVQGEPYVFRVKYGVASGFNSSGRPTSIVNSGRRLDIRISTYTLQDGVYNTSTDQIELFDTSEELDWIDESTGYKYVIARCKNSMSYSEMITKKIGIFIDLPANATPYYIEDVQFFRFVSKDDGGAPLLPDDIKTGEVKTVYYYYYPNSEYTSIDDIVYIYKGEQPANFSEVYNENEFEKIRSITAKESNRFNLLQTLCEIFECWIDFEVEHNVDTGEILLDEDHRQRKWISFHEYIGKDNDCGFKYGINLQAVRRTLNSDGIVSKIVVKNNSNEFAKNGFCTIARATENPTGENFIYDFSYYIQQELLGFGEINNDLYNTKNGYIGYYKKLRDLNKKRDECIEEQAGLVSDIAKYEASYQTYKISVDSAEEQLRDKQIWIKSYTGYSFEELLANQELDWWFDPEVEKSVAAIARLRSVIGAHTILRDSSKTNLDNARAREEELLEFLNGEEGIFKQKLELSRIFYKKYSRFIQEGSWISEDYIDDNLYFLDAESTLHTSSQPKVTYDINVLELSQIPGYESYTFNLGDKTFIEDTEFFGWTLIDGIRTPYKEEIVVTEVSISFEDASENKITVQNYKTQFEDLFQRITATTQAVEYSTGAYNKVSGVIEENGTIKAETLQNSMANNTLIISNAKDQSVIWDETGITAISLSNPAEMLRIVSGGLFLSTDGGLTWTSGITGKGINANIITSGQLNTSEIHIMNGNFPSFRWDKVGLSAYKFDTDQSNGEPIAFDTSQFIRLDQYGLYGIHGYANFDPTIQDTNGLVGEEKVKEYSDFSLTWSGFKIRSRHSGEEGNGYVSITSGQDLQVFDGAQIERIKIGYLGKEEEAVYGLKINDLNGKAVLQTTSDGTLFLSQYFRIGPEANLGYQDRVRFGIIESYNSNHDVVDITDTSKKYSKILTVKGDRQIAFPESGTMAFDKVFDVANEVVALYDDGTLIAKQLIADGMRAKGVDIEGTIHATGGKIGNLTIAEIEQGGYSVVIRSDSGTVFKNGVGVKTLSAHLFRGDKEVTENLTYQWYKDNVAISGAVQQTIQVNAQSLDALTDNAVYSCTITSNGDAKE